MILSGIYYKKMTYQKRPDCSPDQEYLLDLDYILINFYNISYENRICIIIFTVRNT